MANKCAACGSRVVQHEADEIFCLTCGAKTYESGGLADDVEVTPQRVEKSKKKAV